MQTLPPQCRSWNDNCPGIASSLYEILIPSFFFFILFMPVAQRVWDVVNGKVLGGKYCKMSNNNSYVCLIF